MKKRRIEEESPQDFCGKNPGGGFTRTNFLSSYSVRNLKNSRGFTLIEIVITLGLIVLIASIAPLFDIGTIRRESMKEEVETLVRLLFETRNTALLNSTAGTASLSIATSSFYIFTGDTFIENDPSIMVYPRDQKTNYSGLRQITFKPLSGEVSTTGTIVIKRDFEYATITINHEGAIDY